jgi:hypothetical protein
VADCRQAVGEAGERHAMKRAVGVADGRHAVGEAREGHAMKRAVEVTDYRNAVGEARERHAMKREGCRSGRLQACCRRGKRKGMS